MAKRMANGQTYFDEDDCAENALVRRYYAAVAADQHKEATRLFAEIQALRARYATENEQHGRRATGRAMRGE